MVERETSHWKHWRLTSWDRLPPFTWAMQAHTASGNKTWFRIIASNCPLGTLKLWTKMERLARLVMEEMRVSMRQREASPSMVRCCSLGKNVVLSLTLVVEVSRSLGEVEEEGEDHL